jgi:hypothetical protein
MNFCALHFFDENGNKKRASSAFEEARDNLFPGF